MSQLLAGIGSSILEDTAAAARAAVEQAQRALAGETADVAFVTTTVDHDAATFFQAVRAALPGVGIHGITTSLGVPGPQGMLTGPGGAVSVLLLAGRGAVRLAVSSASLDGDVKSAARAVAAGLRARGDELPRVVLVNSSPGAEEALLAALAEELPDVPLFGGSAADNAILGEWSVFTDGGPQKNAVSLLGVFGEVAFGGVMRAPYQPTGQQGRVTKSRGRQLVEIDGRPASAVLNEWLHGALSAELKDGGNILAQTALRPLGLRHETALGSHFLTIHPAHLDPKDGSLELFAVAESGATLCSMTGTVEGLVGIVGQLYKEALAASELAPEQVRAGVLIYCAGCAGAVGQSLHEGLRSQLGALLGKVPLLGLCTFGEQGFVKGIGNLHQDLSVSLLLLGEKGPAAT